MNLTKVQVVALCLSLPISLLSQAADSLIEGPSVQVSQNSTVPVSISSPSGYKVVSGGWEASGGSNELFVPRNYPANSDLNQWLFHFRLQGMTTTTVNTFLTVRRINTVISVEQVSSEIPLSYGLLQNYPNPFNPKTTIQFSVPSASFVVLKVFNSLGTEIEVLLNEYLSPGDYRIHWTPNDIPSGIYFYRLGSPEFTETRKLILLR